MARQVKEAAIDAAIVSVTASDQPILQALADEGLVRGFITRRPSCGLSMEAPSGDLTRALRNLRDALAQLLSWL